jgi:hypothetical protein
MTQHSWSVQDAKNRFSEVVEAARRKASDPNWPARIAGCIDASRS